MNEHVWKPMLTCPTATPVELCRIEAGRIKDIQTGYLQEGRTHYRALTLTHSIPTHWRSPQL